MCSSIRLWRGTICRKTSRIAHLLDVKVTHAISLGYCCHFNWVLSNQLAEEFDGRSSSICLPLDDSELSEVGPSVTGKGFAVFKIKPTKFTRCIYHKENDWFIKKISYSSIHIISFKKLVVDYLNSIFTTFISSTWCGKRMELNSDGRSAHRQTV